MVQRALLMLQPIEAFLSTLALAPELGVTGDAMRERGWLVPGWVKKTRWDVFMSMITCDVTRV
jgi:hypothetical protein